MKILTIGGATQDITFQTKEGVLVRNPKDILRQQLLGFELKAKVNIKQANFTLGGGAINSAINFSNLGESVSALICVGNDALGQEITKNLKERKIKTNLIQISTEKGSGLSVIINAKHLGQEHVLFTYRGANEDLKIDLDKLVQDHKFDLIYLTSLSGTNSKTNLSKVFRYKNAMKHGLEKPKVVWNPGNEQIKLGLNGLRPYLNQTDIFIINKDEAVEICCADLKTQNTNNKTQNIENKLINPRDLMKKLSEYCPNIIVITDGDNGAYAYYQNPAKSFHSNGARKLYFEPAEKIKEKDTTGVGDAFGSTFAWAIEYTRGNIQKSLQMAVKNAAAVLKEVGAQNGLLNKTELLYK